VTSHSLTKDLHQQAESASTGHKIILICKLRSNQINVFQSAFLRATPFMIWKFLVVPFKKNPSLVLTSSTPKTSHFPIDLLKLAFFFLPLFYGVFLCLRHSFRRSMNVTLNCWLGLSTELYMCAYWMTRATSWNTLAATYLWQIASPVHSGVVPRWQRMKSSGAPPGSLTSRFIYLPTKNNSRELVFRYFRQS